MELFSFTHSSSVTLMFMAFVADMDRMHVNLQRLHSELGAVRFPSSFSFIIFISAARDCTVHSFTIK